MGFEPFPSQQEFGEAVPANCKLTGPTGVGKTAAVITRWLYRHATKQPVAARLVIVEPMRTLVSQLMVEAQSISIKSGIGFSVSQMMGGVRHQLADTFQEALHYRRHSLKLFLYITTTKLLKAP